MYIYNHIKENLRNTTEWIIEVVEDGYDVTPEEREKLQAIQTNLLELLEGLEK
jgi:uncharacterized protein YnzC (UPF0291/DUF896 family)